MSHLPRFEFLLSMHLIHVNSQFVFYFSCKVTNMSSIFCFLNRTEINWPISGNIPCLLETFGRWNCLTQSEQCGSLIRFFFSVKSRKYHRQFQLSELQWLHDLMQFSVSFKIIWKLELFNTTLTMWIFKSYFPLHKNSQIPHTVSIFLMCKSCMVSCIFQCMLKSF